MSVTYGLGTTLSALSYLDSRILMTPIEADVISPFYRYGN